MLLDPFEEQLYLPAFAIKFRDSQSRQGKVVGQKNQFLVFLLVVISYSPESLRIIFLGIIDMQSNDLVAFYPRRFVYLLRIKSLKTEVAFGSRYKICLSLIHISEPTRPY